MVGRGQPVEAHALAAWINHALAAPVDWIAPVDPDPSSHHESLAGLTRDMAAGRVTTLVVLDANPLLHAPPAFGFAEALKRVPLSVAFAAFPDETAMATTWRAPLAHGLEGWGDLRGPDGTASLVQPMIKPLFGGRSALAALDLVDAGGSRIDEHARVRQQWQAQAGGDPDRWWRDTLVAGVIAGTAAKPETPGAPKLVLPAPGRAPAAMIVTLPPSPTLWDGRGATNAWAQECPDPVTRQVWGASLRLSANDAARHKLADADIVSLGGVEVAVNVVPGQADGVATLPLGHGRTAGGPIAVGRGTLGPGADGFRLRGPRGGWASAPLTLVATGRQAYVPRNQRDFGLDGDVETLYPVVRPGEPTRKPAPHPSLLGAGPPQPPAVPQWGMVIDASVCIGCNACVVACQAENNVPASAPTRSTAAATCTGCASIATIMPGAAASSRCRACSARRRRASRSARSRPRCTTRRGSTTRSTTAASARAPARRTAPTRCGASTSSTYAGAELWGELDPAPVTAQRNPTSPCGRAG